MTADLRRFAWPLGVSLAAHALLGAWFLVKPAKPASQRPVAVTFSLRSVAAPAAANPATIVAAAAPRPITPPRKPVPKPVPMPAPKVPKPPPAAPAESDEPLAAATGTSAPTPTSAPAPVAGVAFAPPRLGLPFGAAARSTWTPRPAAAIAMPPPTAAGPMAQASPSLLRQQSLDGLAHQVAEWTAPDHLDSARCRVSANADVDNQCDPAALADALAQRLKSLREAWAAYRRLAPEAPAGLVIAYADGRFSLGTTPR
ncbi:MAG TPA: hypothetical protein VGQ91_00420 [Ideonella sp.]|jgi:hypothetical protein|nr:hypothetical protein [Ideonella sp.]